MRDSLDKGMNTVTRWRVCSCGRKWRTVELDGSELAELRRSAYLLGMQEARASRVGDMYLKARAELDRIGELLPRTDGCLEFRLRLVLQRVSA